MNGFFPNKWIHTFIIICIIASTLPPITTSSTAYHEPQIQYHDIITVTIEQVSSIFNNQNIHSPRYLQILTEKLGQKPMVSNATLLHKSISVKFSDGYQLVILSPTSPLIHQQRKANANLNSSNSIENTNLALLLHPFAQVYGSRQCRIIKRILTLQGIPVAYYENQVVDLRFIEENLSASIIYYNTHAGFWDINRSDQVETIVIATGEEWTNDTTTKYSFEYAHQFIVEGVVGTTSYVAFTPTLIEYYYNDTAFTDSLVYMATCHALYDDSMASIFLDKGAAVYLSWTKDTVFWTNSLSSIWTFRLLSLGISIESICNIIGYGGLYNWLFDSTLSYLGDGFYTIK